MFMYSKGPVSIRCARASRLSRSKVRTETQLHNKTNSSGCMVRRNLTVSSPRSRISAAAYSLKSRGHDATSMVMSQTRSMGALMTTELSVCPAMTVSFLPGLRCSCRTAQASSRTFTYSASPRGVSGSSVTSSGITIPRWFWSFAVISRTASESYPRSSNVVSPMSPSRSTNSATPANSRMYPRRSSRVNEPVSAIGYSLVGRCDDDGRVESAVTARKDHGGANRRLTRHVADHVEVAARRRLGDTDGRRNDPVANGEQGAGEVQRCAARVEAAGHRLRRRDRHAARSEHRGDRGGLQQVELGDPGRVREDHVDLVGGEPGVLQRQHHGAP